jgi:hypothetical protein
LALCTDRNFRAREGVKVDANFGNWLVRLPSGHLEHVARQSCGFYKDENEEVKIVEVDKLDHLIPQELGIDFIDGRAHAAF